MPSITSLAAVPGIRVTRTQLTSPIGLTAFVILLVVGGWLTAWLKEPWPMYVFAPAGTYLLFAIKVA